MDNYSADHIYEAVPIELDNHTTNHQKIIQLLEELGDKLSLKRPVDYSFDGDTETIAFIQQVLSQLKHHNLHSLNTEKLKNITLSFYFSLTSRLPGREQYGVWRNIRELCTSIFRACGCRRMRH